MFIALTFAMAKPFGAWLFALYEGRTPKYLGFLAPVERALYRAGGVDPEKEQGWRGYAIAMLLFSAVGIFLTYAIERLQFYLPLNPQGFAGVPAPVAFNTAVSFITNTNWQSYAGESTMSNFTQMVGLAVHNFLSAATGIAIAFALIRGFARRESERHRQFLGRHDQDHAIHPAADQRGLCAGAGCARHPADARRFRHRDDNGGRQAGYLARAGRIARSRSRCSAPTAAAFSTPMPRIRSRTRRHVNFIQMLSIFALGAGLTWTFGKAVGNTKQGWAILAAMMILIGAGVTTAYIAESAGNPIHHAMGVDASTGNMEGKEVRFGTAASALFATVTTDASCGAVNSMHDSFTPIGGFVPLFNIQLGEIIIGGVGSGLYGFLLFAILSIFVAGLMVGRTPEYVGKKIESREVKLAVLAIAVLPLMILGFTALAVGAVRRGSKAH